MAIARGHEPMMHAYEARFAAMFGEGFHAFAFWKGRIALYAILRALELPDDGEVILPGYTCVVVPNAVRYAGLTPIYADIVGGGYNVDPASVDRCVTARTRALIVQHTYGIPADQGALSALAQDHRLSLIEDCAHVLPGSRHLDRPLGAYGRAAFFSFQWSKPYTSGLGGMVITRDAKLAGQLRTIQRSFIDPPRLQALQLELQYRLYQRLFQPSLYWLSRQSLHLLSAVGLLVGSSSSAELTGTTPADLRWRMSEFQKRVGLAHLQGLEDNGAHRRRIADYYSDALRRQGWPQDVLGPKGVTLLRYPLLVGNKTAFLKEAQRARVEIGSWFETPLHPLRLSDHHLAGYQIGSCPIAEATTASVINLPLHDRVTRAEAERIVQFISTRAVQSSGSSEPSRVNLSMPRS
jgi:dTDP-4-amino-4,6-dideoxygalactose transaminase